MGVLKTLKKVGRRRPNLIFSRFLFEHMFIIIQKRTYVKNKLRNLAIFLNWGRLGRTRGEKTHFNREKKGEAEKEADAANKNKKTSTEQTPPTSRRYLSETELS